MKIINTAIITLLLLATLPHAHAADTPAISLASGDVTAVGVEMNNYKHVTDHTMLKLTLTPQKQAEYAKFTAANKGKKTRLFVNGKLYMEPIIQDVVNSREVVLSADTPEHALSIAKTLLKMP
jgi:preprotein translocase subunit SecD